MMAVVGTDDGAARVGVAIDTEVGTGVVHAYVFAENTAAGLPLPLIFEVLGDRGKRRNAAKEISLGEAACTKVIEEGTIVRPKAGDEVAVYASVMGYAVLLQVGLLGTGGKGERPTFGTPRHAEFDEAFH